MISVAELAALPLFANRVPPDELERVSQTAADLRLGAGEYAAHEGDERALFIVISGRIEVAKSIEGVVRKIGVRAPGQIFGRDPDHLRHAVSGQWWPGSTRPPLHTSTQEPGH